MNRVLQIIGAVTLCLTSVFAEPTASAAMATAIGEAFLNGSALTRSSAVLDGDRLTTGASAALILHLAGSSIHIGPKSEVKYHGTTLELLSGSTEIQGRESILTGTYTISPAAESRFTVQRSHTQISIHLLSGSLQLSHANNAASIATPGEYTFHDDTPAPAIKRHVIKAVPIAAGSAAGTSVVIAHWLTAKDAATTTSCVSAKSPTSCK